MAEYIGTGLPEIKLLNSAGATVVSVTASEWPYPPTYNEINVVKLYDETPMATGDLRRDKAGIRFSGEIFFDADLVSQAILNKLILIHNKDGDQNYNIWIKPRDDASYIVDAGPPPLSITPSGNCIMDLEIKYKDNLIYNGVTVLIKWTMKALTTTI